MKTKIQKASCNIRNKKNASLIPVDKVRLFEIAINMRESGLPDAFIVDAVRVALELEGADDLMCLWMDETNQEERNEIIADLQDLIDTFGQQRESKEIYIKFNDLDAIAKNVRAFKDSLYQEVMQRGGVSKLAELTKIPQPSLSRFFNSGAMPQRATVLKIAKALNLEEIKMDQFWIDEDS